MELKRFQRKTLADLRRYCELINETDSVVKAYTDFWAEKDVSVERGAMRPYYNSLSNTPHGCFKVPTGGGKTFLACSALRVIFDNMPSNKLKVVVWLTPSDAILDQTLKNLTDPTHPYHLRLTSDFDGNVEILDKKQALDGRCLGSVNALENGLTVIVMTFDSLRANNKEDRKVYQENGNLLGLSKYNPTPETLIPNVDKTALMQRLNQLAPVVVVDESHHAISDLSVDMLKNLNPSFGPDLTATPRENSNIISFVDAAQLKAENMVKLPVIVYNRPSREDLIADAVDLRNTLDEQARDEEYYIRPIVLFQAQPKHAENNETFEKLKELLVESGIPEEEIAIKTANINELKHKDLLSPDCKIKYIITVNALQEGWDCPFAYILASLANKTSVVDVEQILGRVLRLPYTSQNKNKVLNLSYVLTCSNDFHATVQKIIAGLNNAGFTEHDYRAENYGAQVESEEPAYEQIEMQIDEEEYLQFDNTAVKSLLDNSFADERKKSVDLMLETAEKRSDKYEEELNISKDTLEILPAEVKSKMNIYPMCEQFKDEAEKLMFPQFVIHPAPSLFTMMDANYKRLVSKEMLSDGFVLKDKSVEIDFFAATEAVVEVDVKKNESPKYRQLEETESRYFKEMFSKLPPESRVSNCKLQIKKILGKTDLIAAKDLSAYVDRIVDNMDKDTLAAMEKNIHGFALKIENKIEGLLEEYRKSNFKRLLEIGKIECCPYYALKNEISPLNTFASLEKSLYKKEQTVNDFERTVIERVASLKSVKWWHRNIERKEFYINGFINHYPDFIVYTQSGNIILLEIKGSFLNSNDESRDKAELGRLWQAHAGKNYRYYMVSSERTTSNPYAVALDDLLGYIKEL